jgi:hypothetical protein
MRKLLGLCVLWLVGALACTRAVGPDAGEPVDASEARDVPSEPARDPPLPTGGPQPQGEEKDGQRTGRWVFFHADGKKSAEGDYREGQKDGPWTYWYSHGQKAAEGRFDRGSKTGRWLAWDEDGQQVSDRNYVDGVEALPPR